MRNNDFNQLYNQYYQPLYLYALSLTKNKEDALDLVQNTFIKAYLSYEDTSHTIIYWLIRVLRNEYIDMVRKKKKEISSDFCFEWVEDPYDFTKEFINNEKKSWLYSQILKLPLQARQVMLFSLITNDQNISELLNISLENIRTIRYRTKKQLKEKAKKENML